MRFGTTAPNWSRFVSGILLTGLLLVLFPATARGDHGAWHHNYHVWDPNPSNYAGYAHTYGTDEVDYLYARFIVERNGTKIFDRSISCGFVDEACNEQRTTQANWPQGGTHKVTSTHCGRDGSHHINPPPPFLIACQTVGGTGGHAHTNTWSD